MIDRYSSKEFKRIFSDENRFNNYLLIEEAVIEAYFKLGLIPEEDYRKIVFNPEDFGIADGISLQALQEIEEGKSYAENQGES